jgi:hypothetical protein
MSETLQLASDRAAAQLPNVVFLIRLTAVGFDRDAP